MSATAEEALSRAKAIAARLSGNDSSPSGGGEAAPTTTKRKRWGVAPAVVAAAQESLPGLDAAKRAKTTTGQSNSKRIWVPTTKERPESHFFSFFSDRLEGIADKVNAENPAAQENVKVELKGRGSSNRPPLPGIPEEPLHVVISGPDDLISKADILLDALISEAEKAPVEFVPAEESPQKNSLALTTNSSHQSSYRPATVAQLISSNPVLNNDTDNLMEEAINVPNGVVGFLIGRGGETISSMQARSGCKIQIQKEHELQPGQTHRVITLQAPTQDSIDQCRGMIESMVQDRIRAAGGTTTGSKDLKVNEAVAAGHRLVEVKVPDADVGLIIGKGGSTIKHIQDTTGASIQIPPSGNIDDPSVRTVSVTHPTEEGARMAKHQIEELLKSKPSFSKDQGQQITLQVLIPDRDVGLCIGRQGCVIKEMQHKSGTRIQIPSQPTPGQPHRIATVSGTQDGCNKVQALIERIINEQSSGCVMSGAPFGQQGQNGYAQQYAAEQQGQNNQYSAEWQAYYAAQAAAQQQQQAAPVVPVRAPAPAPAPGADAYYEQYFRYAYYYGEDAARQYYGAWSPPVGTPNPYGVNPNGITAAPAAAAPVPAAAPTPAPAAYAPPGEVRDSSMRKVSNLPAWMTRAS
mmetsp:Transcript_393/g.562  ORF Transcript_393/g.562 Transcript_393/m.562 type:complete len:634 (-) Transcript_393:542-2443(-)